MFDTINAKAAFEFCLKQIENDNNNHEGWSTIIHNNVQHQSDDWFWIESATNDTALSSVYRLFTRWFVLEIESEIELLDFDFSSTKSVSGEWARNFTAIDKTSDYGAYNDIDAANFNQIDVHLSTLYLNNL